MNEFYFTFRSVTQAQAGLAALTQQGIPSTLVRIPKRLSQIGCGYALKLPAEHGHAAGAALRRESVPFKRCFQVNAGGQMEEVFL